MISRAPDGEGPHDDRVAVVGMGVAVPGACDPEELWKLLCGDRPVFDEPSDRFRLDSFWSADPAAEDRGYVRTSGFLHDFRPHPALAAEIAAGTLSAAAQNPVWLRHCLLQARDTVTARSTDRYAYHVGTSALVGQRTDEAVLAECVPRAVAERLHRDEPARMAEAEARLRALLRSHHGYGAEEPRDTLPDRVVRAAAAGLLPDDCEFSVVDAACSSSLYAIGLGVASLLAGACDIAYCGGVSGVTPRYNVTFSKLHGLSPSGDVRAFDDDADGTLFSDGAGVVALKRLDRAVEDGDPVFGVLVGFGGSSDGRGTAIYAPNPVGQRRCLDRARQASGLTADDVDWVIAHGTGTAVGDAVELRTLAAATDPGSVWCGSNKSLLGHTGWSSGVVSVVQALTALRQGTIPAQRRFTGPGLTAQTGDRVRIPSADVPWHAGGRRSRTAGVSAFGFGGTNAHLLITDREPVRTGPRPARTGPDPVVVLAWTAHLPGDPGPEATERLLREGRIPGPRTFGPRYPAPPFPDVRLPPPTVRSTDAGQLMALRVAGLFAAEHGELWAPVRATTGVFAAATGPPPSSMDHLVRCHAADVHRILDEPDRTAFTEWLADLRATTPATTKDTLPGLLPNIIPARIANRYDLGGPTMLVDTGTTSGLTAVHTAVRQLAAGAVDMALVLGVSATGRPEFARFMGVAAERIAEGAFLLALSRESVALAHGLTPLVRLRTDWTGSPQASADAVPGGPGAAEDTFLGADGVLAVIRALHSTASGVTVGPADGEPGPVITLSPADGSPLRQTRTSR
ncbi:MULTISPECIES: beta-ketoacyl synthase N-terminal-like domain-containing protein [Streptomyces]|uniref:AllK n=4 Tax=Streptomyces TaxID=1883 RepID=D6MYN8_9ACTN|nr:beta-ketoacyl synthase N-terminal-like domain-containing protein [Streptomyces tsukubensis]ADG39432.1 AllK [Streptomyces tsukubensis]ADU56307.1 polyketide synthase module-related protein [Streptomyces sp. KCTC 11604BP]ADX99509.1 FujB [Streptomyces sp. MJM7001]